MASRRFLQFSLRTGFIVVTAMCVGLSVWVVPMERKRRAVAAIEGLGGNVMYASDGSTGVVLPATSLRRWLPQVYFDDADVVDLANLGVMDTGLAHLQGLTSLQSAWLGNTQITDAGLVHLQKMTNLQRLDLSNNQVTDVGLAHLQEMTRLEGLWLDNTQVTKAGIAKLQKALPNCQIVWP